MVPACCPTTEEAVVKQRVLQPMQRSAPEISLLVGKEQGDDESSESDELDGLDVS